MVFWPVAATVGAALVVAATALPRNDFINVAGSRLLVAFTVAILVAAAAVRWSLGRTAWQDLKDWTPVPPDD